MNRIFYVEGALYTAVAMGVPIYEFLSSDRPLTGRSLAAVIAFAIVAGCNALKAFLSTSYSRATGDAILVRDSVANGSSKLQAPNPNPADAGPTPPAFQSF